MALEHVHAHRVVHRDVKTSNLFITRMREGPPVVKLGDFGISRVLGATVIYATGRGNALLYGS